jgi:hypothetical protein
MKVVSTALAFSTLWNSVPPLTIVKYRFSGTGLFGEFTIRRPGAVWINGVSAGRNRPVGSHRHAVHQRVFQPTQVAVAVQVSRADRTELLSTYGRVLASGYLIYDQGQTLFAAPFDTKRLALTGPPVSLVHSVSTSNDRADFDVSASGTLVYRRSVVQTNQPFWISSSGATAPVFAQAGSYLSPRLSPDGTRLALSVINDGVQSLWVYDLKREIWNRVTSSNETEWLPTWSPDGEFLVFRSGDTMAWTRSDGSGSVEHLRDASRNVGPWSFSPDGKWLAFWPLQRLRPVSSTGRARAECIEVRTAAGPGTASQVERRSCDISGRTLDGLFLE